MKKTLFYTLTAFMLSPGLSLAQVAPPPEFDRVPGLTPHADVFGMQAWTDDSTRMLWMHDEASGQIIVGYAFDESGQIIHPGLIDSKLGIDNLIDETFKLNEITIPDQYSGNVEALLNKLEDDIRTHVIRDFILRVRTVDNEVAFNTAVEGWIAELKAKVKEAHPDIDVDALLATTPSSADQQDASTSSQGDMPGPETAPPAPVEKQSSSAAGDSDKVTGNTQVALPDQSPSETLAPGVLWEPELIDGVSLREALRNIPGERMGRAEDGKIITVLIDPTCLECQASWTEMRRSLRSADVLYDVHVVPAYSEDSYAIIAGMNPEEPVMRSVSMAIAGNDVSLGRWSDLPQELRDQYYARQDLIAKYKLPALPLFISDTKYASGMLTPDLLDQLLSE